MVFMTGFCKPKYKRYIVAVAHADYLKSTGGVEKLISEHARLFERQEISYVFLCPLKPYLGVYMFYIDGVFHGSYPISAIIGMISGWNRILTGIHIHHILNWHMCDILELVSSIDTHYLVYLHDYYLICGQYTLINSDGNYCGGQLPSQQKCSTCSFWQQEQDRQRECQQFLTAIAERDTEFIAPSQFVKSIWISTYDQFKNQTYVIEHLVLLNPVQNERKLHTPFRIAYIGAQYDIKGWPFFEELAERLKGDSRYEFFHFGMPRIKNESISNIPVLYSTDGMSAMQQRIRDNNIDFAVFFSKWPETYNYTCYEAYLGGAFLITNEISGNIRCMVESFHCGTVVRSAEDLYLLFSSGKAIDLLKQYISSENYKVPTSSKPNDEIVNRVKLSSKTEFFSRPIFVITEPKEAIRIETIRLLKKYKLKYPKILKRVRFR